jgi:hypothetical protein
MIVLSYEQAINVDRQEIETVRVFSMKRLQRAIVVDFISRSYKIYNDTSFNTFRNGLIL